MGWISLNSEWSLGPCATLGRTKMDHIAEFTGSVGVYPQENSAILAILETSPFHPFIIVSDFFSNFELF